MIIDMRPLSLAEVKKFAGDLEEKKEIRGYLKKFGKTSEQNANKLLEQIKALDNNKLKEEYIVKIIDFLPRRQEELNKIFGGDIALDEKEIDELLEIIGKY